MVGGKFHIYMAILVMLRTVTKNLQPPSFSVLEHMVSKEQNYFSGFLHPLEQNKHQYRGPFPFDP